MATKWHTNLPSDWDDVPSDPPEDETDSVIEPYGDGVVMRPLEAAVDNQKTAAYLYCDARSAADLGEEAV